MTTWIRAALSGGILLVLLGSACMPEPAPTPFEQEKINCEGAFTQLATERPDAVTSGHLCAPIQGWCGYRPPGPDSGPGGRVECNADGPNEFGQIDSQQNYREGFAHELGHAWWTNRLTDAQRVRFDQIVPAFNPDYGVQERHAEAFAIIVYGKASGWVMLTQTQINTLRAEKIVP